jgi:alkanesulfonate monooxygenase SsuD/methylene tetrahydromethanopterin reductase-like flavin-dependent oxidoreductase (luciferase family)
VGIGWNAVEYEALGEDFGNRGKRSEEQIEILRRLWQEPVLTYHGKWHTIVEAGLKPLPIQRPIPVWIGGTAEIALDRAARIADGWFPIGVVDDAQRERLRILLERTERYGRNPSEIGIDARIDTFRSGEGNWERNLALWQEAGATHLCVNGMNQEFDLNDHIAALERFMTVAAGYR